MNFCIVIQIPLSRAWIHAACDKKLFHKMKAPNLQLKAAGLQ